MPNHRGCWLRIARRIIDSLCHLLPSTVYRIKPFSHTIRNRILWCDYRCGLRFNPRYNEGQRCVIPASFYEDSVKQDAVSPDSWCEWTCTLCCGLCSQYRNCMYSKFRGNLRTYDVCLSVRYMHSVSCRCLQTNTCFGLMKSY